MVSIKNARTALEILENKHYSKLNRSIAHGVLKLFIDQREKQENEKSEPGL